ncbi:MAG: ABC transporter permease [Bacteroides sp.]|nr:ABC transporter permease [Bacteroides sp.]
MSTLKSIIRKEFLHIVRDSRTSVITVMMPLVLLLLFGFAISTEVNDVRVIASVDRHTPQTRLMLKRIEADGYFTFLGPGTPAEIEDALRKGTADAGIVIKDRDGKADYQIIADASNPNMASTAAAYIQGTLEGAGAPSPVISRTLYNPQLRSSYNFVPGIMGMIFILVCAIMTSVSIVREKEAGTMNLLLVSPVRPATVIIGKLIPYFILSCVILAVMLGISYGVLGIPLSESVVDVVLLTLLYILLSLSIGLLVSTIVRTQLAALLVSAVIFMMPVIFLSGMLFPIDNMPRIIQHISCVIPARWYISALRKMMIQQLGFRHALQETAILAGMTVVILTVAIRKFNTKD